MANQRQQLKVTTRKSRSPARRSSPNTRSSSKAGSPISEAPTHSSHLYNPPHLHFTHQQPVKETHLLDIDFDPISGRKCINRYEIIDEIGRGTHGKVKLGRDLLSSEHVAIKIVERNTRPRLGKMVKQEDEKVRREIAILKKCRHNNVVRLIEVIDDPASKKVYLVLEYVELGEIAWRKLGHRDVLRRERLRLKQELVGEDAGLSDLQDEDEENLRRWKRRRRKQLKLQHHLSYPPSRSQSRSVNDENPNCWSLELGGLTEEDDGEISDDYPSVDEDDDQVSRSLFEENRPQVDAPHIPPLDSDSEEPTLFMRSLSMMAISGNPEAPPYSFSHEDLQYVPALTFEQARTTFRDTVLGLEYLHYNGIIHRDIKPANLLWTKEYRVKISDFGVSYLGRGAGDYDEDEFGEKKKKKDQVSGRDEEIELAKTVGTPAFFAPELCFFDTSKTRPQITSAIDVWALGVTLYCLVFARCPFLADGEFELFNVIAKQELYIPKRRLRPAQSYIAASSLSRPSSSSRPRYSEDNETELIPDDLRDLLEKLLTKDPAKRISIREVKRHPWVLYGLDNPFQWIEETDPERMSGGGRIEVNQEEMEKAVVPASWGTSVIGRVRSGINKL
ncbi:kinase-like domain-containing protein, partial [Peziza echinospora]